MNVRKTKGKKEIVGKVTKWFPSVTAIVIGPGLGRDPFVLECVEEIIEEAKSKKLPMVIDGDGLFLVTSKLELLKGGEERIILTPNVMEAKRLANKILHGKHPSETPPEELEYDPRELAQKLGGVAIVNKGKSDLVTDGKESLECDIEGSQKRCGGQGDLLAGNKREGNKFMKFQIFFCRNDSHFLWMGCKVERRT